jgi:site-specific DNA-cytosine methylase
MTTVGQVELDPWCRQVLARHWPDVPRHDDVRTAPDWWASTERPTVDVVCGGFPWRSSVPTGGLPRPPAHQRRRLAREWLERQPDVARLANGVPAQVDRLRVLGNAVVPQVAEHVGRLIVAAETRAAA